MRFSTAFALALTLMLAGCAGHKTRPGGGHASRDNHGQSAVAASHADGDDTTLPQSRRYKQDQDGGPDHPPADMASLPEPVPHVEPRSRYGNKSTYSVRGKTYHVLASSKGYDRRGIASWYGKKFNGYMTSSFEKYDMYKFTAAHKTLPLPTWVRVTNLENGKSVIVRVNDRGPFVSNRLIDLSYAAAVRIGIWPHGTGLVQVQAIDPAHPEELPPPDTVKAVGSSPGIWLQVGAFSDAANAERVARKLRTAGLGPVHVTRVSVHGKSVRRVRVGPLKNVTEADRVTRKVVALGLPQPQVAVD